MKLYHINFTKKEREELVRLTTTGRHAARKVMHARILLKADECLKDEQIAKHLDVSVCTVERVRKRCAFDGITAALNPKKGPQRKLKLDGEGEARLVQLACSEPLGGRQCWTLHLLADKLVRRQTYSEGCCQSSPPSTKGAGGIFTRPVVTSSSTLGRFEIPSIPFFKGEVFVSHPEKQA